MFYVVIVHSFVLLSSIALYGYIAVCLSTHLLMNFRGFSSPVMAIINKAAMSYNVKIFM